MTGPPIFPGQMQRVQTDPLLLVKLDKDEVVFANGSVEGLKVKMSRQTWREMGRPELVSVTAWPTP